MVISPPSHCHQAPKHRNIDHASRNAAQDGRHQGRHDRVWGQLHEGERQRQGQFAVCEHYNDNHSHYDRLKWYGESEESEHLSNVKALWVVPKACAVPRLP